MEVPKAVVDRKIAVAAVVAVVDVAIAGIDIVVLGSAVQKQSDTPVVAAGKSGTGVAVVDPQGFVGAEIAGGG